MFTNSTSKLVPNQFIPDDDNYVKVGRTKAKIIQNVNHRSFNNDLDQQKQKESSKISSLNPKT